MPPRAVELTSVGTPEEDDSIGGLAGREVRMTPAPEDDLRPLLARHASWLRPKVTWPQLVQLTLSAFMLAVLFVPMLVADGLLLRDANVTEADNATQTSTPWKLRLMTTEEKRLFLSLAMPCGTALYTQIIVVGGLMVAQDLPRFRRGSCLDWFPFIVLAIFHAATDGKVMSGLLARYDFPMFQHGFVAPIWAILWRLLETLILLYVRQDVVLEQQLRDSDFKEFLVHQCWRWFGLVLAIVVFFFMTLANLLNGMGNVPAAGPWRFQLILYSDWGTLPVLFVLIDLLKYGRSRLGKHLSWANAVQSSLILLLVLLQLILFAFRLGIFLASYSTTDEYYLMRNSLHGNTTRVVLRIAVFAQV